MHELNYIHYNMYVIAAKASISPCAATFRLVLGYLISSTEHDCDFRVSEIMNFILYSVGVIFILRWMILKGSNGA
jgi:hypothetical protein